MMSKKARSKEQPQTSLSRWGLCRRRTHLSLLNSSRYRLREKTLRPRLSLKLKKIALKYPLEEPKQALEVMTKIWSKIVQFAFAS
jgi:hypothetical protein